MFSWAAGVRVKQRVDQMGGRLTVLGMVPTHPSGQQNGALQLRLLDSFDTRKKQARQGDDRLGTKAFKQPERVSTPFERRVARQDGCLLDSILCTLAGPRNGRLGQS